MAANDEKRFSALGSNWTARFDFNAVCDLEDSSGVTFVDMVAPFFGALQAKDTGNQTAVIAAMKGFKMSNVRLVLYHALLGNHPDITVEKAGSIIADMGMENAMGVVGWAMMKGMGKGDVVDTENPPQVKPKGKVKTKGKA